MDSYHPASQPRRPWSILAAAVAETWPPEASKWATPRAAPTTTRATTQGTIETRSAHHTRAPRPSGPPVSGRPEDPTPPILACGAGPDREEEIPVAATGVFHPSIAAWYRRRQSRPRSLPQGCPP